MAAPDSANLASAGWQQACAAKAAGDYRRAAAAFAACPPDPQRGAAPALFEAGWCLELGGDAAAAAPLYERALAATGEPALALEAEFRLGWIARLDGDTMAAGQRFARVLDLAAAQALASPTVGHARFWLAAAMEEDGRLLDAAALYAAVIAAGDPALWHEAAWRRLQCLALVGDLDGAAQAAAALAGSAAVVDDPARLQALQALAREELAQIARARAAA